MVVIMNRPQVTHTLPLKWSRGLISTTFFVAAVRRKTAGERVGGVGGGGWGLKDERSGNVA